MEDPLTKTQTENKLLDASVLVSMEIPILSKTYLELLRVTHCCGLSRVEGS